MASLATFGDFSRSPLPQRQAASVARPLTALLPISLLVYAIILPPEMRFSIADQTIFPFRLMLLLLFPWLLVKLFRGTVRVGWIDAMIFAGCGWMVLSMSVYYGFGTGFLRGGALAFDFFAGYLVGRVCIRQLDDLRRLLIIVAPGLLIAGLLLMLESVLGQHFVRPTMASIFGPLPAFQDGEPIGIARTLVDYRLGLLRSMGTFRHPILAGLFLASFIALFVTGKIRGWPFYVGMLGALMAFFSISSAVFLAMLLCAALLAFDYLKRKVAFLSWRLFLLSVTGMLAVVHFASNGGLVNILIRFTLNPQTGRFRRLIWEHGSQSVMNNPWFGIGFTAYERPRWMITPSVDAHWLMWGIRHGLVTPVLMMIAAIAIIGLLSVRSLRHGELDRRLLTGMAITVALLVLMGFTVGYFGSMSAWFAAVLGMGLSLANAQPLPARLPTTAKNLTTLPLPEATR
jgi:hypothetical protein